MKFIGILKWTKQKRNGLRTLAQTVSQFAFGGERETKKMTIDRIVEGRTKRSEAATVCEIRMAYS